MFLSSILTNILGKCTGVKAIGLLEDCMGVQIFFRPGEQKKSLWMKDILTDNLSGSSHFLTQTQSSTVKFRHRDPFVSCMMPP